MTVMTFGRTYKWKENLDCFLKIHLNFLEILKDQCKCVQSSQDSYLSKRCTMRVKTAMGTRPFVFLDSCSTSSHVSCSPRDDKSLHVFRTENRSLSFKPGIKNRVTIELRSYGSVWVLFLWPGSDTLEFQTFLFVHFLGKKCWAERTILWKVQVKRMQISHFGWKLAHLQSKLNFSNMHFLF